MARQITKLNDIETTAIELFASRGLAQVTVKEISEHANCAEGALYRHYKSKEEMAWLLFRREVEKFGARLRKVLHSSESFAERIRASIELFYKFFDEDRVTFSFILLAQHDFPPEWKIDQALNPDALVAEFIKKGMKEGKVPVPDANLAAAMVLGLVLQPATMCAQRRLKGPLFKKAKIIEEACLKILGVREEADHQEA
jgi:AcrR family transcriptional regulator